MGERHWFAAAGAVVAVIAGLPVVGGATPAASIVIHLEDQIRMPPEDLNIIRTNIEEILNAAGVTVSWAGALQRPIGDLACDGIRHVAVSIIRIQQPFANDAADTADVLGRSAPAYARAWVFWNRIVDRTADRALDVNLVVARAIAHEIGHLLLPDRGHGAVGIMRASLDLDGARPARFTSTESALMRSAVAAARTTASSGDSGRCR
jgi:hypothetical protein